MRGAKQKELRLLPLPTARSGLLCLRKQTAKSAPERLLMHVALVLQLAETAIARSVVVSSAQK